MLTPPHPNQNQLLAALPAIELVHLMPHLELIQVSLGDSLWEVGRPFSHVYFPTSAIISLRHILKNGSSSASSSVGCEGMLGMPLFMGGESAPSWAMVHTAGFCYSIKAPFLLQKFTQGGPLQCLLLRYTHALITEVALNVVCNRHHKMEQQLSRWLLSTLDRLGPREFIMTQELIANILGVRREGITEIAKKMQQAGIIRYQRGHITVLDRAGLEGGVCECYDVIKKEFDRVSDYAGRCEEKAWQ